MELQTEPVLGLASNGGCARLEWRTDLGSNRVFLQEYRTRCWLVRIRSRARRAHSDWVKWIDILRTYLLN